MTSAFRKVEIRLSVAHQGLVAGFGAAAGSAKQFGNEMKGLSQQGSEVQRNIGRTGVVVGGVVAAGFGLAAKTAIDFESAFAGVKKTVSGTPEQFAKLRAGILQMSRELPASAVEIAGVAEAAGQLGIQTDNILGFTRTMVDLGETTNLSASDAATQLARLANITGLSQSEFDRMGSTIVALGNNLATTESEIVTMALRLAAAGDQAGLTEADILAIAGSLSSLGIEAEAGGTAFSRVIRTMRDAVINMDGRLQVFAQTSGMTAQQFADAFRTAPAEAITAFLAGLQGMIDRGESVTKTLDALELDTLRVTDTLGRAAGANEAFADALELGNESWRENNALTAEAEQRYATTASQIQIAWNNIQAFAIGIGDQLLPMLGGAAGFLTDMVAGLESLPGPVQGAIGGFTGLAGALGGVAGGALLIVPKFQELAKTAPTVASAVKGLGIAGVAAGAGLGLVAFVAGQIAKKNREAQERADKLTTALREQGDPTIQLSDQMAALAAALGEVKAQSEDVEEAIEGATAQQIQAQLEADGLLDVFNRLDVDMASLTEAVAAGSDNFEDLANHASLSAGASGEFGDVLRRDASPATREFVEALAAAVDAKKIDEKTARALLFSLNLVADAHDDVAEATDAQNKKTLEAMVFLGQLPQVWLDNALALAGLAGETHLYTGALERLEPALNAVADANGITTDELLETAAAGGELAGSADEAAVATGALADGEAEAAGFASWLAGEASGAAGGVNELGDEAEETDETLDALAERTEDLAEAQEAANEAVAAGAEAFDSATQAISDYFDEIVGHTDNVIAYQQAIDDTIEAVLKQTEATGESTVSLDLSTQAGRDLQSQLNELTSSIGPLVTQTWEQTGSAEAARAKAVELIEEWKRQAAEAGLNKEQIDFLTESMGLVPDEVITALILEGFDTGELTIREVLELVKLLDGQTATVTLNEVRRVRIEQEQVRVNKIGGGAPAITPVPGKVVAGARGGDFFAGQMGLVGEEGPELGIPLRDMRVFSAPQTRALANILAPLATPNSRAQQPARSSLSAFLAGARPLQSRGFEQFAQLGAPASRAEQARGDLAAFMDLGSPLSRARQFSNAPGSAFGRGGGVTNIDNSRHCSHTFNTTQEVHDDADSAARSLADLEFMTGGDC